MRRTDTVDISAEALRGALPQRLAAALSVLGAALASVALGACVRGADDAGPKDAPTGPVSQIESSDGPLFLGAPPAELTIGEEVLASATRGVVDVRAKGCGPVANGSAFAIAPGLLVGAAHVVTGASSVEIEWSPNEATQLGSHLAEVVGYTEDSDLALLRTKAGVHPLSIDQARLGATGAVLGFDGSSEFLASPARIEHYVSASGLWGGATTRSVYVLAADVRNGQSGGPLVDREGSVVGVAFASIQGPQDIGFAFSSDELVGFLASSGIDARVNDLGDTVITADPASLSEITPGECSVG